MKLSENFTLWEFEKSSTAKRKGLSNKPNIDHIDNLQELVNNILQPLRDKVGSIRVTSGFRSTELNKAIGGAHKIIDGKYVATSQHCKGQAADIQFYSFGKMNNRVLFDAVLELGLEFDQMIEEFDYTWIHISFNCRGNRNQILSAYSDNGRTRYKDITKNYK